MLTLVLLSLLSQSVTAILAPNTSFKLGFHAGATDNFRLYCNKAILYNFKASDLVKTPRPDGLVDIIATVPSGLPAGSHVCEVGATNAVWEAAGLPDEKSDPATIAVGTAPVKPLGVRFVIEVKAGG